MIWFGCRALRASVAVGVAVAGSLLGLAAGAAPAGAATSPAVLTGLACRSTSLCFAVGVNTPTMSTRLAGNEWNGTRWSQLAVPDPPGAVNVTEFGLSCPSGTRCVGVGYAFPAGSGSMYATASYLDGTHWTSGRAADPGLSSQLDAVACVSATSCFAVGQYSTAGAAELPLIEHWNGSGWTRQAAPLPVDIRAGALADVSCASSDLCVAVGAGQSQTALEERWNGHAWSTTTLPHLTALTLSGVSCYATTCSAVGGGNDGNSVGTYRMTGSTWSFHAAPAPGGGQFPVLQSVSCPLATRCLAVGNYGTNGVFADAWNGSAWTRVPVHESGGLLRYFEQIRCVSWAHCIALGSSNEISAGWRSESAFWNGASWEIRPTA